ncbi:dual specificity protein phosphatase family protein [Halopenitus malekzadehii]|uniref:dual specificity protein phosphatase family protein n=1 Tax=Halopenitus malekzadehii TaxID=1267564 RepID=UPI000A906D8A
MDEVTNALYVGSIDDAGDQSRLAEHRISVIISLTFAEPETGFPPDVTVVRLPMMDGPQNDHQTFVRAVNETLTRWEAENRVLVHCSAGASRSPAVAATVVSLSTDRTLESVFQQLKEERAAVEPHEALLRQAASVSNRGREYVEQAKRTRD